MKDTRPGLLILGASGGVSGAFLQLIEEYRDQFSKLVLVDRVATFPSSPYHNHQKLDYVFLEKEMTSENCDVILEDIIQKYGIQYILDNTDADTEPILAVADRLGVHYLNCALNPLPLVEVFVEEIDKLRTRYTNSKHVLGLGMNPGIINHFVLKLVKEYGTPNEFVEIEYESGKAEVERDKPFITWSRAQFLAESVLINTGLSHKGGVFHELATNALSTTVDTREYLEPIKKLDRYPRGMIVPHDEIIMLSYDLKVPGKFVYALHEDSFNKLIDAAHLAANQRDMVEHQMILEDNVHTPLMGSDCIGAWLYYDDKKVCYYMDVPHTNHKGTNATLFLVAVGALAGLLDFMSNPSLTNGVHFVSDLNTDNILSIVSKYAEIQKQVITITK
jgi:homospermidine synthase